MFDDLVTKKVVGHVPFCWSRVATKFLQFPNHQIHVTVTRKRVNRGAGFGLEIPVNYIFYGNSRVIFWLEKNLNKLEKALSAKIEKCVK